jgi:hypothetical protein
MQTQQAVNGWLRELAGKLGAENFSLDENGSCTFEFDGRFQVGIEAPEESEIVHLYAVIAAVPADETERAMLCERLLKLNLFGEETGGAAFAIHEATNNVLLCFNVTVEECDAQVFENRIGNFIEVADRWHAEFGTALTSSDGASGETPDLSDGAFIRV